VGGTSTALLYYVVNSPLINYYMDKLLKTGRIMFATGILALSVLCFIYGDFIIGRPPAWPAKFTLNPALGYASATLLVIAGLAILLKNRAGLAALLVATLILLLSVLRHVPHFMDDWVNAYKAMALFGGALIIAASFFREDDHITPQLRVSESWRKRFVVAGTILLSVFLIACGFAHFKWAQGVQNLVPGYIPFHLFWTYFAGVCLIAGGAGILIPKTKRWAALLSGIMILCWFLLLHIPALLANPTDPSNRMGVCESFIFSGVLFVLALY